MDYYIAPEEPETDFLRITKPEEIRICDPAAGSGHMLTYAFDLLYAIYEEEGYDATEIPALILTHNLTGVEIDDRAGALAAFALAMKAAARLGRRRFLRMEAKPDICVLQNVAFTDAEMQDVAAVVGKDLFTDELRETLGQFEQAKNFGSLIVPRLRDPAETLRVVETRDFGGDLLLKEVQARVIAVLRMAEALSPKYHAVVANPPYMGGKGMNGVLSSFLSDHYEAVSSDLFSAFVVRNCAMTLPAGQLGFMTPFVWMFISSYEDMRKFLLGRKTISSLIQLEYSGFDGATVPICTFTIENRHRPELRGAYVRLSDFRGASVQGPRALQAIQDNNCGWFYRTPSTTFDAIPGNPILYQLSNTAVESFSKSATVSELGGFKRGTSTADNNRFLRNWFEVSNAARSTKWRPYNKGGEWRRWYGNQQFTVNWGTSGNELKSFKGAYVRNTQHAFKPAVSYSSLTSGAPSFRFYEDHLHDQAGNFMPHETKQDALATLASLNSKFGIFLAQTLSPTLNILIEDLGKVPVLKTSQAEQIATSCVSIAKSDWDAYETSWDFTTLPLLSPEHRGETLAHSYATLRAHWQSMTDEMKALEEENNRIFIDAYGLQDELTSEVPIEEITLTCNPAYRFKARRGSNPTEAELDGKLKTETIKEFLSYAVGCMFGRYSLDAPGLILANQGETLEDYLAKIPSPSFEPDDDNVIPILDGDWFSDDITQRFRDFLRVTFGEEHFVENLEFIEEALGKDIRKYFFKDFYNDHVKRYKKRPIYWQFSSPRGYFNALIYMHRYRSDTVSIVLNDYLRDFKAKLQAQIKSLEAVIIDPSTSDREKTKAGKEIDNARKALHDIETYESEILFPLAEQQIEIDLDDGVKQNYPKFGKALKKVTGLSAK